MSEEIKAKSHEEAQELADAIGKGVTWEHPSQYPPYEPSLGFFEFYRLRLWLVRKRAGWAIRRRIKNIAFKFTRGKKK